MPKALLFVFLSILSARSVLAVTLYDASLGTLPSEQSWVSFSNPGGITYQGTMTRMTTTPNYGDVGVVSTELTFGGLARHPLMPVLNIADGFEVSFSLQILSESHNMSRDDNNDGLLDRAGFSVLILSTDLRGIEIAFFIDKIWAYEDDKTNAGDKFTQAENAVFDTTKFVRYKLVGSEGGYSLFADGVNILSGHWRTYHPSGVDPFKNPYDNPSSLFFADNTQSAASDILLGDISVEIGPFPAPHLVPIPISMLVILNGALLIIASRFLSQRGYREKRSLCSK